MKTTGTYIHGPCDVVMCFLSLGRTLLKMLHHVGPGGVIVPRAVLVDEDRWHHVAF